MVSCPQRVCCWWRDIWTPFCWGLGTVVSLFWPEQAALLPVSTCASDICLLMSKSWGEPQSLWPAQELSAALCWDQQVLPFPFASECLHHETLNVPASPMRMTRWDELLGHLQGPYCTPMLWERSRLWFTGLILMSMMWTAFYVSTHSYEITSEHIKPCSWTLVCRSSYPWGSWWDEPKSIGNWRLRDEMCSGKQGETGVFSCTWEKSVLGWKMAVAVFYTSG